MVIEAAGQRLDHTSWALPGPPWPISADVSTLDLLGSIWCHIAMHPLLEGWKAKPLK
jgi:hypothetical protein